MSEELLDQIHTQSFRILPASAQKRFFNFILDGIFFCLIIGLFFCLTIFLGLGNFFILLSMLVYVLGFCGFYFVYYWIMELSFNGKSFGKFITKTRVVKISGLKPDFIDYFVRSITRLLPLDGLSFLFKRGSGYHDIFSKTVVIDEEKIRDIF